MPSRARLPSNTARTLFTSLAFVTMLAGKRSTCLDKRGSVSGDVILLQSPIVPCSLQNAYL
jgi:hypothetical protein